MSMRLGFRGALQNMDDLPLPQRSDPAVDVSRSQCGDTSAFRLSGSFGQAVSSVLTLISICALASGCGDSGDAAAYHTAVETKQPAASSRTETSSPGDATTEVAAAAVAEPTGDPASDAAAATASSQDAAKDGENAASAAAAPSADLALASAGAATENSAPKYEVLVKQKDFKKDPATDALRVTYDDLDLLKVLNMKQATAEAPKLMPEWMKNLDGKRVRIRGFMHPQSVFQEAGIARFVFCRDTGVCCFGPNPTIYYLIEVTMKKGTTTRYIDNHPFDVVGTFRIQLSQIKETGEIFQLYHINDADVIER